MKKQLIISLFTAAIVFAGAYNSFAEMCGCTDNPRDAIRKEGMPPMRGMQHPGMGMMDGEHPMWRDIMVLGLDEKQKEAIKEIKSRGMKEMIKRRADERVAGIELKDLIDKDPVDIKAVEAKLKQIDALKTEMHLSLIRVREEVKSKLTPDQRKKFNRMPEMEPIMGPPMMGGMMHGDMRMPPPPCEKDEEIQPPMERMRH
jgi:Spy/CpxP family protein refolding chaperone